MDAKLKAGAAAALAVVLVVLAGVALLEDPDEGPQTHDKTPGSETGKSGKPRPSRGSLDAPSPGASRTQGGGVHGTDSNPGGSKSGSGGTSDPTRTTDPKAGTKGSGSAQGPVSVEFRCENAKGQPLAGVRIDAKRKSGMPLQPVISDAQGVAHLGGLPIGAKISGAARHPGSRAPARFGPIAVAERTTVRVRLTEAPQGRLRGAIRDEAGNPISEAELVLVNPEEKDGAAVLDPAALQLRPDGSFAVDVAAGTYTVSARAKGVSESDRAYVQVPAGGDSPEISLTVTRQGSIQGRLQLPADVVQLRPLELDVVIETKGGTERNPLTRFERRPIKPNQSLEFSLQDCHAGQVRMRLELPRAGDNRVGPWVVVKLEPGNSKTGVVLTLQEVAVSVKGTVRDDRGAPMPDVVVQVNAREVKTDHLGAYAARGLDMGSVAVQAKAKGHGSAYEEREYKGATLTVDLVLARLGSVTGSVRGSVVSGVTVNVVANRDGAVETFPGTTDAQGTYTIKDIPPGTYYVKAGKGADLFEKGTAPAVTVESGKAASVTPIDLP